MEDARAVAAELGNPALIGHSSGGLIVQKLAEMLDPPAAVALVPAARPSTSRWLGFPVDGSKARCPMLVIGAGKDRITPAKVTRRISERYGADLRWYERHAHMIPLVPDWERVAGDVAGWLDNELERKRR